jgi:NAD(P)-dependent dehydrogenase (short-subunit alcohol dehydrogenase family)
VLETLRLEGKSVVITGAGRGLGKAMARALAQAGAKVVCAARTREQIDETVEEIRSEGGTAFPVVTDVTDSAQVDALVGACLAEYGKLDVMVANAGAGTNHDDFWEYTDEEFDRALAINLSSAFYCGRVAARTMIDRGSGGVIVNVSSISSVRGTGIFAYPTAKGGIDAMTISQATILGRHGIRVNAIMPGRFPQLPPQNDREAAERITEGQRLPVGRVGECWELGPLAVYLASEASSYVTGASFVIDGGALAGGIAPVDFSPERPISRDQRTRS